MHRFCYHKVMLHFVLRLMQLENRKIKGQRDRGGGSSDDCQL
jgi:hypothetical protein